MTFDHQFAGAYNLAASPDWQALLTHFELGEGFALLILLVPNKEGAIATRTALQRYLADRGESFT